MPKLDIQHIRAGYGDLKVLFDVSLHVDEGEIVSLVGSNGAGKTTLLRIISGFEPVTSGSMRFGDRDLISCQPYERAALGISHIPQGRGTLTKFTVQENLIMGAYEKKAREHLKDRLDEAFAIFPKLRERRKQIAGSLSGGEQQMLAIARALMMNPKLIIMDEPSLGLAPIIVEEVFEIIRTVASNHSIAILIVEQNLVQALSVAHRGYVLENGRIAMEGKAQDLLHDPDINAKYLGI